MFTISLCACVRHVIYDILMAVEYMQLMSLNVNSQKVKNCMDCVESQNVQNTLILYQLYQTLNPFYNKFKMT